jgi:cell division protein FtsI (penicillin-binding protein 3)
VTDPFDPYGMFDGAAVVERPRPRVAPRPAAPAPARRRPPGRPPRPEVGFRRPGPPPRPPRRAAHRPPAPARRLRLLLVVFCVLFAAVVVRLSQLQVVDRGRLDALGEAQVVRSIALPADRGAIVDRSGNDLALSVPRATVWADPRSVEDPQATAAALAPVLGLDAAFLTERLSTRAAFVYLARQVDQAVSDRVEDLALAGVHLLDEPARFAPAGDLARSVVGSVNIDGVGRAGLELAYDDVLAGEPGELVLERDPDGRTIPQGERQVRPAVAGDDLVLTIDRGMQHAAEQALIAQVAETGARGAIAIVMHPQTGEIYAMANVAVPESGGPPVPVGANQAVTSVFEPGSVNKVITVAGALEERVVAPDTRLTVPDHLAVSDHVFRDHDPHPTASWNPTDILATSSNIGTIMLGQGLGRDRLDEYLRRFGFGEQTALGFPGESGGLLLDADEWSGTSIGSIPLGHGVAVTAMQMLAAYNVLANDGVYVEPKLVLATIGADGARQDVAPSATHRVVSEQTATQVRDMLVTAVESGTGTLAAIDGYAVAGKTGTARKPQPGGGYQDAAGNYHYVATFAGFVPAQDPQLSIIVVVDEPSNGYYASQVSAPVFAELARFGLRQFRVPPPATPFRSSVPALTVEPAP